MTKKESGANRPLSEIAHERLHDLHEAARTCEQLAHKLVDYHEFIINNSDDTNRASDIRFWMGQAMDAASDIKRAEIALYNALMEHAQEDEGELPFDDEDEEDEW